MLDLQQIRLSFYELPILPCQINLIFGLVSYINNNNNNTIATSYKNELL